MYDEAIKDIARNNLEQKAICIVNTTVALAAQGYIVNRAKQTILLTKPNKLNLIGVVFSFMHLRILMCCHPNNRKILKFFIIKFITHE